MRTRQVRWYEGMLVLPHHFQAAEDNYVDWISSADSWLHPFNHGLRSVEVNRDALSNYEVRITHLEARLRDGTILSVPENAKLQELNVQSNFESSESVYIHLMLPRVAGGRSNTASRQGDGADEYRFLVDTLTREDLNVGSNSREIETHCFNLSLRAQADLEPPRGFDSLPLFRLRRSRQPGAVPELDPDYIPPVLSIDAWPRLRDDILLSISSQIGSFLRAQADALNTQGGWAEGHLPQVHAALLRMSAANASYPVLLQLFQSRGIHPFTAYIELCRLVGQLSIGRGDWQPPRLPLYDHDDLATMFKSVRAEVETMLGAANIAEVLRFPFADVGEWIEIPLNPEWMGENNVFFIGIHSMIEPPDLERLFAQGHLDWKLGASRVVTQIYQNAESGLQVERVTSPQTSLPSLKNMTYFRIDNSGPYWRQLMEAPTLAIKVNDRFLEHIESDSNRVMVTDEQGRKNEISFELFVVKNG